MTGIRPIGEAALPAVLALNNLYAEELSLLDAARLAHLVREAFHARVIGEADAFLIAFDKSADYDSENYLWFRRQYPRFVYVDRVAVAASARGRGLARALYEDVFAAARAAGHDVVVAEVNDEPPIRPRTPSMRRSVSRRSAAPSSMAAASRCATTHVRYRMPSRPDRDQMARRPCRASARARFTSARSISRMVGRRSPRAARRRGIGTWTNRQGVPAPVAPSAVK